MDEITLEDDIRREIWNEAVKVICGIVTANNKEVSEPNLMKDESFDIQKFHKLRNILIPRLGRPIVPRTTLVTFVNCIFQASLLYAISRTEMEFDIADRPEEWRPLNGSTVDLNLERRSRMSYVCL